jgi:hypothetical protein
MNHEAAMDERIAELEKECAKATGTIAEKNGKIKGREHKAGSWLKKAAKLEVKTTILDDYISLLKDTMDDHS